MPVYYRPVQRPEALELLGEPRSRPVVLGPCPEPWPHAGAESLVDLGALGLAHITAAGGTVRLGGLAPLAEIVQSPVVASGPARVIAEAAAQAAQPGLLRVATLAGALISDRGAHELRLALLVLDATVVVETAAGSARLDVGAPIPASAIVVEVVLPPSTGGTASARAARTPRDLAIVAATARVDIVDGLCRAARLAVAGASARPGRVAAAEQALEGRALTPETLSAAARAAMEAADPVADFRGSADYRREMAGVLARRALEAAWRRAER